MPYKIQNTKHTKQTKYSSTHFYTKKYGTSTPVHASSIPHILKMTKMTVVYGFIPYSTIPLHTYIQYCKINHRMIQFYTVLYDDMLYAGGP